MEEELGGLQELPTWVAVQLPEIRRAALFMRLFKRKLNATSAIEHYKASLVIKGSHQRRILDYDLVFSHVVLARTNSLFFSIVAANTLSATFLISKMHSFKGMLR
jgi:hypothetical protein